MSEFMPGVEVLEFVDVDYPDEKLRVVDGNTLPIGNNGSLEIPAKYAESLPDDVVITAYGDDGETVFIAPK